MQTQLRRRTALVAMITLLLASLAMAPGAQAQEQNPYQRGPNPTQSSIEAARGPYSVATTSVSSASARGFGGGTIYYPTGTSDTFGAIAIAPGFTASQSSMSWYGPRLASQGFVVFTIDTNGRFDQPGSRADQLLAALDYLTGSSTSAVRNRIDSNRLAVMGHSMGGGGSIEASNDRPSLKASIPLTPWHGSKSWSRVSVPTLIVGAENDSTASVSSHSIPFYNSIPSSTAKAYLELDGASHFAPNSSNTTIASYSISWLKRFVDNDTRYNQFLCGPNHTANRAISDYRSTCPYGSPDPGDPGDPGTPGGQCVRDDTRDHVSAGRATSLFGRAYAVGTRDSLGSVSSFNYVSLQQVSGGWALVNSCP